MKKFRLLGQLAAIALAVGLCMTGASATFTDTEGHWASDAIDRWSEGYGIITGYEDGSFRPDQSITRGAFAGIMDRFLKFREQSDADTFSDTAGTYWEEAILKLHASGVYLGSNGKANPGASITRQQAVTMIARAFGITASEYAILPYSDAGQIASYAQDAASWAVGEGLITGMTQTELAPQGTATRAQVATILKRFIEKL